MTLGRTSTGAVKIKTDNGGLRAVNCACCGGCSCGISIPQALRGIVANATINTITMFGLPPTFFYPATTQYPYWRAYWGYACPPPGSGGVPCNDPFALIAEIDYAPETGCLSTSGFYTEWNPSAYPLSSNGSPVFGYQAFGDGQFCEDQQDTTTQNGTFTINGEGAYTYYYFTGIDPITGLDYLAVPPPNFVFT